MTIFWLNITKMNFTCFLMQKLAHSSHYIPTDNAALNNTPWYLHITYIFYLSSLITTSVIHLLTNIRHHGLCHSVLPN